MDELECPLCGEKYYSLDCPHDFQQMENDVIALRAENERQAKAKSQIIKQLNDAWVERDALRAENDVLKVSINNLDRELENTVKDCDALRAQLDKSIPIEIRTANWIMEKNNRVFALAAERDNLRAQLDIAVKFVEYIATPMSEPITPREQIAQYRAIDALSEIAKMGGGNG